VNTILFQAVVKKGGKSASGKGKKKKVVLRFVLDCTQPVEDGIMNVGDFVSSLLRRVQVQKNFFG